MKTFDPATESSKRGVGAGEGEGVDAEAVWSVANNTTQIISLHLLPSKNKSSLASSQATIRAAGWDCETLRTSPNVEL
jgi:hypothetical protein